MKNRTLKWHCIQDLLLNLLILSNELLFNKSAFNISNYYNKYAKMDQQNKLIKYTRWE